MLQRVLLERINFSAFASNIEDIMEEFENRFADFDGMKFQLELCDIQADPFFYDKK